MQERRDDRPLGELFSELSHELTTLVRDEVKLAKAELGQKASVAAMDVGLLAFGGALAYAGLLALVAMAIIALSEVLAWWLAALIVGVVLTGFGGMMVLLGIAALRRADLMPHRTIQTLREDAEWTSRQMR